MPPEHRGGEKRASERAAATSAFRRMLTRKIETRLAEARTSTKNLVVCILIRGACFVPRRHRLFAGMLNGANFKRFFHENGCAQK
jgi:hypothetical protein